MKHGLLFRMAQDRLRDFIRDNHLRAGDRLPAEAVLAAELEVSRISLREATRSLQTLGVIEARPGNGLYVGEFSFRPVIEQLPYGLGDYGTALEDVLMAREAMETGLMTAVLRLADDEHLARCAGLAARITELERAGESYVDADREFHLTLYAVLKNPLVESVIELFWDMYARLGDSIPLSPDPDRGEAHLQIVRALQAGDATAAMAHMIEHFDGVRRRAAMIR